MNGVAPLVALGGAVVAMMLLLRLWRYPVVKKFKWMTDEEVDAFFKQDPGF